MTDPFLDDLLDHITGAIANPGEASATETFTIRARPVWARSLRRALVGEYGGSLNPPTENEKRDAIAVLSDESHRQWEPGLYLEAERILDEAGR